MACNELSECLRLSALQNGFLTNAVIAELLATQAANRKAAAAESSSSSITQSRSKMLDICRTSAI